MAQSTNYVQGFRTVDGVAKYDYNALANLPSIVKLATFIGTELPPPSRDYVGTIALVEDENQNDVPYICYQKKEGGSKNAYVWATFDGSKTIIAEQQEKLAIPVIVLVQEAGD